MTLAVTSLQPLFGSLQQISKYIVAFSGGMDSTVLLHVMHKLKLPMHVIYVNHHLQKDSNQWEQHCIEICKDWNIPISIAHAKLDKGIKKNIEESARNARYKLLFEFVKEQHCLVTAHHRNDLAETLLLQLLRGSGPAGLAAMAQEYDAAAGKHIRPLLAYTRAQLLEYAQANHLTWIEDASNDCLDFNRNYIRKEIMPNLLERWPGVLQTFSRVTELQAEAIECLSALAKLDLQKAKTEHTQILLVSPLRELNLVRLKNALRAWIQEHNIRVPSSRRMEQICTDIIYKDDMDSSPVQTWVEGEVRRYRDRLYIMTPLTEHDATQTYQWNLNEPLYIESLNRTLQPSDLKRNGVKLPQDVQELTVRFRIGGERLKPFGQKHHRSLKNLFQEAKIPPWERDRIPLLFYKDQLISVLGYWNVENFCETKDLV